MIYLVAYDISETGVRNRIIGACLNRGMIRVQRSVFLGDLASKQKDLLWTDLKEVMKAAEAPDDSILMMPACERCIAERRVIGHPPDPLRFSDALVRFL